MDDLERSIRAASPLRTRRNTPLSERAERELEALLSGEHPAPAMPAIEPRTRIRRTWPLAWAGAAAAAALAVVLVVASIVGAPAQKSVAAPPLLQATPMDATLDEVLAELSARARKADDPPGDAQVVTFQTWSAAVDFDPGLITLAVQPIEGTNVRRPDGSGSMERRAGDVLYAKPGAEAELPAAGTLLERYEFGPGEFPLVYRDGCPDSAESLDRMLRSVDGVTDESVAGDYFERIQLLRMEWALTGKQTAAAIDLIAALPGVSLLGNVTDRLGREGVAIQTDTAASGAYRDILVFSPVTGLLLSSERIYLGGIANFKLSYPTVMDYAAWKDAS